MFYTLCVMKMVQMTYFYVCFARYDFAQLKNTQLLGFHLLVEIVVW